MSGNLIYNIFFLLGGIAVMMFGMRTMGSYLEQLAGNNMKKMLGKMTNNRFAGVGVGAAVTAIINSSTATTVMLVGFVNVGLMSLSQAAAVIMGANIGTTITAQILSLSGADFEVAAIAALIAAVGMVFAYFLKKDKLKKIGFIMMGIGMIFLGLKVMSMSVDGIIWQEGEVRTLKPFFEKIFNSGNQSPLLLGLIGIVLTALIHSSAAITGILIVLAGALKFENAVFIILGSNIGTCVTALLSSVGTSTNAKRTAVLHLLFNLFGCIIILIPLWIWRTEFASFIAKISGDEARQIANFHTFFNIFTTLILLPFTNVLVYLTQKIIPEKNGAQEEKHKLTFIDERLLETPPIAMDNTKKEIVKMSAIAQENIDLSIASLVGGGEDTSSLQKDNEDAINYLSGSITRFMTKLMGKSLSATDEKKIGTYYHVVIDVERVGDYAENILEYSEKLKGEDSDFSDEAKAELIDLKNTIDNLFKSAVQAFMQRDVSLLPEVDRLESKVDEDCVKLEAKHVERVKKGQCTASLGSIYLQAVSNLERVADHITNIAFSILQYTKSNMTYKK